MAGKNFLQPMNPFAQPAALGREGALCRRLYFPTKEFFTMLYRKNITRPESLLRVAGGVALIAAGLWWMSASPLGLALAASGVGSILSGAFGYCPACAMVGRKPVE
jgi:hypothetical protein